MQKSQGRPKSQGLMDLSWSSVSPAVLPEGPVIHLLLCRWGRYRIGTGPALGTLGKNLSSKMMKKRSWRACLNWLWSTWIWSPYGPPSTTKSDPWIWARKTSEHCRVLAKQTKKGRNHVSRARVSSGYGIFCQLSPLTAKISVVSAHA